ncbi:MAG: hypothetical protein LDL33_10605 [Desulfomonile sp.]|nr:hypothetical protein [Desulfomonile sp.]
MPFSLKGDIEAAKTYATLKAKAKKSVQNRQKSKKTKASKEEGLFKQVRKCIKFLLTNPRHPGLETHPYSAIPNPYNPKEKVFEAYVQQNIPPAYRVFWCYGPEEREITIIAITAHP